MPLHRNLLFLLALAAGSANAQAGMDILACGTKEREAVTPSDPLNCQWKLGPLDTTLAQLYEQNWRLIEAEFFNGDRAVLYLERETTQNAAPGTCDPCPSC